MRISKHFINLILIAIILVSLSSSHLIVFSYVKPSIQISKQNSALNISTQIWSYVNFGQKRLISSLLWIATILESDHEHYQKRDLNSWMFLRFRSISELEPKFYENYAFSGPYLSVIKDDLEGATYMYNKGLSHYPDDYYLLNQASFHFYYEKQDLKKSYEILKKLNKTNKASALVKTALSRIEADRGDLVKAFEILSDFQKTFKDKNFISQKIYDFRYSIKAEIDLNCLNLKKVPCSTTDLDGNSYIRNNGVYIAAKEWTPYRPKWIKK